MTEGPYLKCDKDEVTYKDIELVLAALVHTKWPPGTWFAPPDQEVSLYEILGHGLTVCGLGERLDEVYQAARQAAEQYFANVVKVHEEIRQDVAKKHGQG